MKVVPGPAVRRDLLGIGDWIARDDPLRAETFIDEVADKAESLSDMPRCCPVAYRTVRYPAHKATYGNYLIFYRVLRSRMEVLRFQHGARSASGPLD